jgi:hypothetical protein
MGRQRREESQSYSRRLPSVSHQRQEGRGISAEPSVIPSRLDPSSSMAVRCSLREPRTAIDEDGSSPEGITDGSADSALPSMAVG